MARKLIVEIIGDTRNLQRSFGQASASATKFDRSITHATRGVIAGSGAISHLGRSLAFASGGFIAFAGVTDFLRQSVDAARAAGVAQRQLATQMHAVGESFRDNKAIVQDAQLSLEKFGFTSEDSAKALTVLERGTGSITRSLRLQGVAANLARAKNLDLAAAATTLAKVFGGQETALRRAVPGLSKTAHGMDLIRQAAQKLSGQAAAGTTEVQRFHATLHDTEVIIGNALLPTIDKLLKGFGDWLRRMNETGKLQKDVNSIVQTGTQIFQGLKSVISPLVTAFKTLGTAVGGTKNEIELLVAAFAAFKISKLLSGLGLLAGLEGFGGVAAGAKTATAEVNLLRLALLRLGPLLAITAVIEIVVHRKQLDAALRDVAKLSNLGTPAAPSPLGTPGSFSLLGSGDTRPDTSGNFPGIHFNIPGGPDIAGAAGGGGATINPLTGLPRGVHGAGIAKGPLTAAQQLKLALAAQPDNVALLQQQAEHDRAAIAFAKKLRDRGVITNKKYVAEVAGYASDLASTQAQIASIAASAISAQESAFDSGISRLLDRVQDIPSIKAQIVRLKQIGGLIAARIKSTSDVTRRLQLEDQQLAIFRQIKSDRKALAQAAADAFQVKIDWAQFSVDAAATTKSLADDVQALNAQHALMLKQLALAEKQGKDTLALQQQLLQNRQALKGVQQQQAQNRLDQANAAFFKLAGRTAMGEQRAPATRQLIGNIEAFRKSVQGLTFDTPKFEVTVDKYIDALKAGGKNVSRTIRLMFAEILSGWKDAAKKADVDVTKFSHIDVGKTLARLGLKLSPEELRQLRTQFSVVGPHGSIPSRGSLAFAQGGSGTSSGGANTASTYHIGTVHLHGVQNPDQLESLLEKRARSRAAIRRGT